MYAKRTGLISCSLFDRCDIIFNNEKTQFSFRIPSQEYVDYKDVAN